MHVFFAEHLVKHIVQHGLNKGSSRQDTLIRLNLRLWGSTLCKLYSASQHHGFVNEPLQRAWWHWLGFPRFPRLCLDVVTQSKHTRQEHVVFGAEAMDSCHKSKAHMVPICYTSWRHVTRLLHQSSNSCWLCCGICASAERESPSRDRKISTTPNQAVMEVKLWVEDWLTIRAFRDLPIFHVTRWEDN